MIGKNLFYNFIYNHYNHSFNKNNIYVYINRGTINTLKLSPNLRLKVKPTKKQLHLTHRELEIIKLERLLSFVREPLVLPQPKDTRIIH